MVRSGTGLLKRRQRVGLPGKFQPVMGVRPGALRGLTSILRHSPLRCSSIACPGSFAPLGVLRGEHRALLKRLGRALQER